MLAGKALDAIGISEGTDKTSLGNDYLRHYGRMLEPFRDAEINVLELGVGFGGSLKSWRRFFTAATIVGVDIEEICNRHHDPDNRIHVHIGSQTDIDLLDRICAAFPPTIVIDDGSHHADHQFVTFNHLWPRLPPGGCYIVEDIFFQMFKDLYPHFRGPSQESMLEFLGHLAVARSGGQHPDGAHGSLRAELMGSIDRMEFFHGAVGLWKADAKPPVQDHAAFARRALERSSARTAWDNFFNYMRNQRQPLAELLEIAQKAREVSGEDINYHNRIADLYLAAGDIDTAIAEMEKTFAYPHAPEWEEGQRARIAAAQARKQGAG